MHDRGIATKNEVVRHFTHVDKYYGLQEIVVLLTYVARLPISVILEYASQETSCLKS